MSDLGKIVFCFDGTCNDPADADNYFEDSSISNILKLHAFLGGKLSPMNGENSQTQGQRSFYYSGIGTRGNWLKQKLNAMIAPVHGDMDDILDDAEKDLGEYAADSTEIYIFGFSRGAAIARMFAAHLAKAGRKVKFLGVFDTVAATRKSLDLNPNSYPSSGIVFENGSIAEEIEEAVHLVSIDEKRIAFQPTLFNHDERVKEVWFAGVHSDIGRGYWFDGLSDICLQYMIDEVKDKLAILDIDQINFKENLKIKGSQDDICKDDLNIKSIPYGKLHEQKRFWKLADTTLAPRVVRVNENDKPSEDPDKLPIVHHTVLERFKKVPDYRPYALRDARFCIEEKNGKLTKKHGIASLK